MVTNTWYAIKTISNHEHKVAKLLIDRAKGEHLAPDFIKQVVVPEELTMVTRNGKKATKPRKVFPGYVFVQMTLTDDTAKLVRSTSGVTGFIQSGVKPVPMDTKEVDRIFARIAKSEEAPISKWQTGMQARITEGPFSDFIGLIMAVNEQKQKLTLQVNIFGRDTPVEIEYNLVEPV